ANGLRSGWSTPILSSDGSALGIFGIYGREPRSPTPQHQHTIKQITHLASIAIERKQAAESRSEEHTSELQSRVDLVCRLLLEKRLHSHLEIHSFPTRRSSDLGKRTAIWVVHTDPLFRRQRIGNLRNLRA